MTVGTPCSTVGTAAVLGDTCAVMNRTSLWLTHFDFVSQPRTNVKHTASVARLAPSPGRSMHVGNSWYCGEERAVHLLMLLCAVHVGEVRYYAAQCSQSLL